MKAARGRGVHRGFEPRFAPWTAVLRSLRLTIDTVGFVALALVRARIGHARQVPKEQWGSVKGEVAVERVATAQRCHSTSGDYSPRAGKSAGRHSAGARRCSCGEAATCHDLCGSAEMKAFCPVIGVSGLPLATLRRVSQT